jgi:hypothetical protein
MEYENRWPDLTAAEQIDLLNRIAGCADGTVHNPMTNADSFLYILYSGKTVIGLYQWSVADNDGRFVRLSIIS